MSMDLTGIKNRNEYYTNHYFSAIFADNARDTISQWRVRARDSKFRTPWSRLREVSRLYYVLREQYRKNGNTKDKNELVQELAQAILDALDYPKRETIEMVEIQEGLVVPV